MLLGPVLAVTTLTLTDSSGAVVRSTLDGSSAAVDLYTAPMARAALALKRSSLTFGYSPRVTWVDALTDNGQTILLQSADAGYTFSTRRLTLSLDVAGSIGRQTFLNAARQQATTADNTAAAGQNPANGNAGTPAAATFFPQTEVVKTGSLDASLSAGYLISRRWRGALGISYVISGGLGDSQAFIPLRRGPLASASATAQASRRDALATTLSSGLTTVPRLGGRFFTLSLLESWTHNFRPRTAARLGAGATYLRSRATRRGASDDSVLAAGGVGLTHTIDMEQNAALALSTDAQLTTGYNPVLGTVSQVASATVGATYVKQRFDFGINGRVSQTLPTDDVNSAVGFGAAAQAGYRFVDALRLDGGGAWSRQIFPNLASGSRISPNQWSAFIALTLSAPPITF